MDKSKKYIEMCEKAEEIQNSISEFNNGDLYTFKNEEHDTKGHTPTENRVYTLCLDCALEYGANPKKEPDEIWLPRQDQLQGMITNKGYFGFSLIELFYHFANEWHRKKGGLNSMEQLWLAFVMKEKWNKVWNGKEWGG